MNFYKDNNSQTGTAIITHISCSGLSGSCSTSIDTKMAAEALDKTNNGHCHKT